MFPSKKAACTKLLFSLCNIKFNQFNAKEEKKYSQTEFADPTFHYIACFWVFSFALFHAKTEILDCVFLFVDCLRLHGLCLVT